MVDTEKKLDCVLGEDNADATEKLPAQQGIAFIMAVQKTKESKKVHKKNTSYRDNIVYHERLKRISRERYHKDPVYRKATLERARKRYHEDEEYRAATIRRARERTLRLKNLKKREKRNKEIKI